MTKRLLTTALLVISALVVQAGNSEYSIRKNRINLDETPGYNEIKVSYPVSPFYVAPDEIRNYGKVTLDYNREQHSDLTQSNEWRFSVELHVYESGTWQTGSPVTLTISWEEGNYVYSDYHIFETSDAALERKIQVIDVVAEYKSGGSWVTATNPLTDSNIPSDIHLELSIKTERFYELDAEETHFIRFDENVNELRWPFVQGAEEYDIEWVFLDAHSAEYLQVMAAIDYATTESANPGVYFYDNYTAGLPFELKEPTRINVSGNRYTLDMTYPEGALFFRMRPVGRYVGPTENPGGDYESVKPGAWTYSVSDHPSNQVMGENYLSKYEISSLEAFAANQNWLYGINFAEDGKSVSTLSYYDGAFRGRQAAVYNTSDDITLVGESKFDYEGRQTISVIPAPVEGRNFVYQENFNQNTSGTPFEKDDFDKTAPEALKTDPAGTKGSAQYFSVNNTFTDDPYRNSIPDAGGYVYSQVRFNKDATGRISETAGIGEDFAMGNGHTVKYFYGNTTEFELRRLFGKEVGEPDNYKKIIVLDPNGQAMVSYVDNHGRVIASGLAGDAPANLVSLDGTSTTATTSLSVKNMVNSPVEKTSKQVIPNYAGSSSYTFYYDFDGVLYGVENPNNTSQILCIECEYEFSFVIVKPDGTALVQATATFTKDGLETCSTSAGVVNYDPSNGTLSYGPYNFTMVGEYEVYKKLIVSSNTQANFDAQIATIIGTEQDFVEAALENVDIAGCFTTCDDYCDYVAGVNYMNQDPAPSTPWDELTTTQKQATTFWDDCMDADCNIAEAFDGDLEDQGDVTNGDDVIFGTISQCDGIRLQMEEQVSPGGIFFEDVSNTLSDFWSLFPGTILTLGLYPDYEADGTPIGSVITTLSYLQNPAYFQTEWLPVFITFHREYCHYDVCLELNALDDGNGINSMEFDILMAPTQTWTSSPAVPYITFSGHPDPFVGSTLDDQGSSSNLIDLLTSLDHPCSTGTVNLEDYVDALFGSCSVSLTADEWTVFYGMYQNLKQTQINAYKTSIATNYAAGCLYYDDGDEIVINPVIDEDPDNDSDFDSDDIVFLENLLGGPGIISDCGTTCDQNVDFWIGNFPPACIDVLTSTELTDLEMTLSDYCVASCQAGNLGGWMYDDGSVLFDDFAADVATIFTGHSACSLDAILVTAGTFTVSDADILVENPCLPLVIEAFNALTSGLPIVIGSGHPLVDCGKEGTGEMDQSTTSGEEHILVSDQNVTSNCPDSWVFRVFNLGGTAIDITTIASFSDLEVSQVVADIAYITIHPITGAAYPGYLELSRCYESFLVSVVDYTPPTYDWTADCINATYLEAMVQAQEEYSSLYNDMLNQLMNEVNCMKDVVEVYKMDYTIKEYQYTLYYYDQAGNLVSTVPPLGVDLLANTAFDTDGHWNGISNPVHTLQTLYEYNGANLLTKQKTPDGGTTRYYYDDLYRLRFSQNEQQLADNKFSYTKFDELGRITEAGEAGDPGLATINFSTELNNYSYPGSGLRRDYSKSYYETGYGDPDITAVFDNGQQNLRNRIGAVEQFTASAYAVVGGTSIAPIAYGMVKTISSYSYDEHGNVNELVQTNSTLEYYGHAHKKMVYEYDLLSGQVKQVIYQGGEVDEWRHKYHYDANNRLVRAWTSDDGEEWEMDAKYFYYLHGNLARVETGHDKVQGTDYAYNMQGWLKGANGTYLDASKDIGQDGHSAGLDKYSGQDAYGYYLGYFDGDYTNIGATDNFAGTGYLITQNGNYGSLYNGNISHMVTAMKDVDENKIAIHGNIYTYDQLQRIISMDVYRVSTTPTNYSAYLTSGFTSGTSGNSGTYAENYTYDANGNIQTLFRNGDNPSDLGMDDFVYHYLAGTNKLDYVEDLEMASSYTVDIQNTQAVLNYDYNGIGQLTKDVDEGITLIEWTATHKVRKIHKGTDVIEFVYDAMGNRVMKVEGGIDNVAATYTYYVHDASGNVMATYTRQITGLGIFDEEAFRDQLKLSEKMIYGSKRLGLKGEQGRVMAQFDFTPAEILTGGYYQIYESQTAVTNYPENFEKEKRKVSEKFYEFSNHLGNVLEVTTDRKIANTGQTAYEADIVSYSDYYPFGMVMPGRNGSTDLYRYGFQGQEKDDEIKGVNNSVNYKYRMHDPRIGRFFAVDPLAPKYPHNSPYAFSENRVTNAVELEGLEADDINPSGVNSGSTMVAQKTPLYGRSTTLESDLVFVPESSSWSWIGDDNGALKMFMTGGVNYAWSNSAGWYTDANNNPYVEGTYGQGHSETFDPTWEGAHSTWEKFSMRVMHCDFRGIAQDIGRSFTSADFTGYWNLTSYQKGRFDGGSLTGIIEGLPTMVLTTSVLSYGFKFMQFSYSYNGLPSIFGANSGYGYKIGNSEFFYSNPNVYGGTIWSYRTSNELFRLDYHMIGGRGPMLHFHQAIRTTGMSNRQFNIQANIHRSIFTGEPIKLKF